MQCACDSVAIIFEARQTIANRRYPMPIAAFERHAFPCQAVLIPMLPTLTVSARRLPRSIPKRAVAICHHCVMNALASRSQRTSWSCPSRLRALNLDGPPKTCGIGEVGLRNSNHFVTAVYPRLEGTRLVRFTRTGTLLQPRCRSTDRPHPPRRRPLSKCCR
jgi:hypothetical protein